MDRLKDIGNAVDRLYKTSEQIGGFRGTALIILLVMVPVTIFLAAMFGIGYYLLPLLIPDSFLLWVRNSLGFASTKTVAEISLMLWYLMVMFGIFVLAVVSILLKKTRK